MLFQLRLTDIAPSRARIRSSVLSMPSRAIYRQWQNYYIQHILRRAAIVNRLATNVFAYDSQMFPDDCKSNYFYEPHDWSVSRLHRVQPFKRLRSTRITCKQCKALVMKITKFSPINQICVSQRMHNNGSKNDERWIRNVSSRTKQNRQCAHNITLRRVHETNVAVEKQ